MRVVKSTAFGQITLASLFRTHFSHSLAAIAFKTQRPVRLLPLRFCSFSLFQRRLITAKIKRLALH